VFGLLGDAGGVQAVQRDDRHRVADQQITRLARPE
jgi:hypothetical protein